MFAFFSTADGVCQHRCVHSLSVAWSKCLLSFPQLMVAATMDVYKDSITKFLPTPSKSHYVFNLRDFARVIRGVLLVPSSSMTETEKLIRLWVHEVYRVFYDRLIDPEDR